MPRCPGDAAGVCDRRLPRSSPWFDVYRNEARDGHITLTAGDSIGATPPISAFFGDRPAIEMMNAMGFGVDGLGNHNFDVNEAYMRGTIAPLANFPFLSSNVVDAAGNTPAEWQKSKLFRFGNDLDLALIGFTNDDAKLLTRPTAWGPFNIANSTDSVNAEIPKYLDRRGKRERAEIMVAMGHLGATAGSLTAPTGPAVDLSDALGSSGSTRSSPTTRPAGGLVRPNGVLLTENRSKGLVHPDPSRGRQGREQGRLQDGRLPPAVGHRRDADPAIQTRINQLNAELAPILGTQIGTASVAVRRTKCGRPDGRRLCESRVGNVVTDAMRTTYLTDFALTNSGGLRADLTCPSPDLADDFCPAYSRRAPAVLDHSRLRPRRPAVREHRGDALAERRRAEDDARERRVADAGRQRAVPAGVGPLLHVRHPAGGRQPRHGAVRQAADGSCTGAPID